MVAYGGGSWGVGTRCNNVYSTIIPLLFYKLYPNEFGTIKISLSVAYHRNLLIFYIYKKQSFNCFTAVNKIPTLPTYCYWVFTTRATSRNNLKAYYLFIWERNLERSGVK